jgi:hypothetical protein
MQEGKSTKKAKDINQTKYCDKAVEDETIKKKRKVTAAATAGQRCLCFDKFRCAQSDRPPPEAAVGNGGDGAHGHTAGSSAAGAVSRAMRYCSAAVEKGCSSSLQCAIALSRIVKNIPPQQQHRTSHEDNASDQNSNTQVLKSDEQNTRILMRSAPAGRKLFFPSAEPDGDHEAVAVGEVLSTRSSRGGGCGRGPKHAEITRW